MKFLVALILATVACGNVTARERIDAGMASTAHAGLRLSATVSGAVIDAVLENIGERPITVVSQVAGPDRMHFDGFSARVGLRELRFSGARNSSGSPLIELAPGASAHHRLDLIEWSTAVAGASGPINPGGPLPRGRHRVTLSYVAGPGRTWWAGELVLDGLVITIP